MFIPYILKLSAEPDPARSIVAIHGLKGHWRDSWVEKESDVFWLADLLGDTAPNARVMSFSWPDEMQMRDIAAELVMEVGRSRAEPSVGIVELSIFLRSPLTGRLGNM
jgi:hypothetical protein